MSDFLSIVLSACARSGVTSLWQWRQKASCSRGAFRIFYFSENLWDSLRISQMLRKIRASHLPFFWDEILREIKSAKRASDWGDWKRETWHRETIKIVGTDIARLENVRPCSKGGHRGTWQRGTRSQGWTSRDLFQCSSICSLSFFVTMNVIRTVGISLS